MKRSSLRTLAAAAVVLGAAAAASAQEKLPPHEGPSTSQRPATPATPPSASSSSSGMTGADACGDMSARHAAMQREMAAQDARLDQLVARMNGASGPAKVDAMAAVLTEMVAQQRTLHAHANAMMALQAGCSGMSGMMSERTGAASGGDTSGDTTADGSSSRTDPVDRSDPKRGNQPGDDAGRTEHGDPQKPR